MLGLGLRLKPLRLKLVDTDGEGEGLTLLLGLGDREGLTRELTLPNWMDALDNLLTDDRGLGLTNRGDNFTGNDGSDTLLGSNDGLTIASSVLTTAVLLVV